VERAKGLGADAVIPSKVDVLESMGSSPQYESTVNPAGRGYCSYTRGLWMVASLSSGFLKIRPKSCGSEGRETVSVRRYESARAVRTHGQST
jgi:hypothetical protein